MARAAQKHAFLTFHICLKRPQTRCSSQVIVLIEDTEPSNGGLISSTESIFLQGSSSSSSGKASRGASRKYSSLELGTIAEESRTELRGSITGSGKRATSVSWADLQHPGSQEAEGSSGVNAQDARLIPTNALTADRAR